jgi:hypothetical protein
MLGSRIGVPGRASDALGGGFDVLGGATGEVGEGIGMLGCRGGVDGRHF